MGRSDLRPCPAINTLRAALLKYFPALERAFDSKKAPLILVSGYQTPRMSGG